MRDFDNPVIPCTLKELVFIAWQLKRLGRTSPPFDQVSLDFDMDARSVVATSFRDWWQRNQDTQWSTLGEDHSFRNACWRAWSEACEEPDRGDLDRFTVWWRTYVEAQPTIG